MNTESKLDYIEPFRQRMRLEEYFEQVDKIILSRQHPITGLMPASTAITVHGDYTDAWVRDNVYSILAVWGLAIAYRRQEYGGARAYSLEQSVVKLMRGLLTSMMKQSHKVEAFKHTLDPMDALHAKYDTHSGNPVVGDDEWGHLQLDATSLFLLMLAQMTASGLRIIFNQEEVDFVQNLVHYISKTYLTPDFGLWERGAKRNEGMAEINASSVGIAKAALEALRGFDLYGGDGDDASRIHVVEDDIARARETLETLLPRESGSKEIDAALLSIIGFPSYAVENLSLLKRTRDEIVAKLEGKFGCKRFLRDGHQTVVEDHDRLYYEEGELQAFENIESEWPLFFTYQLLDGLMREDEPQASKYRDALQPLFVEEDGLRLLPELYIVPQENIDAERANPGSQSRVPNENVPLVWAQSLYLLSALMMDGYIFPSDIDPLDRRWAHRTSRRTRVQLTLLAEHGTVQAQLEEQGVVAQTVSQIAPVHLASSHDLAEALCDVGRNEKLKLTGRPPGGLDTLATSQVFTFRGEKVVFLPPFLNAQHTYFHLDNRFLVEQIKSELHYIQRNWQRAGQPMMTLLITESMLIAAGHEQLTNFLRELKAGMCGDVQVRMARLAEHLPSTSHESIDYLRGFQLSEQIIQEGETVSCALSEDPEACERIDSAQLGDWQSNVCTKELVQRLQASVNLYEQIEIADILWEREGPEATLVADTPLSSLVEEIYQRASQRRIWGVMRRAAALLEWYDQRLEDEVAKIIVRRMRLAVGRSYSDAVFIDKPISNEEIVSLIRSFGGDDPRGRLLIQEIVLLLGKLVKRDPQAFRDTYTLQCWHLLLLLTGDLAWELNVTQDQAFDALLELSPQTILERLRQSLISSNESFEHLASVESLKIDLNDAGFSRVNFAETYNPNLSKEQSSWRSWRESNGRITRLSEEFCTEVWESLGQCSGIVIGDRLDAHNRLDSQIVRADMTPAERNFARLIEDKLTHVHAPEYRQLVMEALHVVSRLLSVNDTLQLDGYIVMDVLLGHAVKMAWQASGTGEDYNNQTAQAWSQFYDSPPHQVANSIVAAFEYLMRETEDQESPEMVSAG